MSTVAEQLREGREAQKLTIQGVAEITKIRSDHIRALEEGNFNVFSAPVYIRGFVRTCATLLKLDVPQVMSTLEGELGQTEKFREPPPLTDQPGTALESKRCTRKVPSSLSRANGSGGDGSPGSRPGGTGITNRGAGSSRSAGPATGERGSRMVSLR